MVGKNFYLYEIRRGENASLIRANISSIENSNLPSPKCGENLLAESNQATSCIR